SVAVANHSSSTIGGASGSSRTAASISSSVSASTRAQSVRGRSASVGDFCFEEFFLTDVGPPGRDDPASRCSPSKNDSENAILDSAERLESDFSVSAIVYPLEYGTIPNQLGGREIDPVLLDVAGFFFWVPFEVGHPALRIFIRS